MKINGQSVSRETQERLEHFVELFKKWNKTTNLVAPSTLTEALEPACGRQCTDISARPSTAKLD